MSELRLERSVALHEGRNFGSRMSRRRRSEDRHRLDCCDPVFSVIAVGEVVEAVVGTVVLAFVDEVTSVARSVTEAGTYYTNRTRSHPTATPRQKGSCTGIS